VRYRAALHPEMSLVKKWSGSNTPFTSGLFQSVVRRNGHKIILRASIFKKLRACSSQMALKNTENTENQQGHRKTHEDYSDSVLKTTLFTNIQWNENDFSQLVIPL
jgi:hypothetical protein